MKTIECVHRILEVVEKSKELYPFSKVIISPVPPCRNRRTDMKIDDVNQLVYEKTSNMSNVSWIYNNLLYAVDHNNEYKFLHDQFHLSSEGVKILASAFKRSVKSVITSH